MANPKRKPKHDPGVDAVGKEQQSDSDQHPGAAAAERMSPVEPIKPQPIAFRISLVLFVAWLLYLAFVAYKVMS